MNVDAQALSRDYFLSAEPRGDSVLIHERCPGSPYIAHTGVLATANLSPCGFELSLDLLASRHLPAR
jgi:hypothetical protein